MDVIPVVIMTCPYSPLYITHRFPSSPSHVLFYPILPHPILPWARPILPRAFCPCPRIC